MDVCFSQGSGKAIRERERERERVRERERGTRKHADSEKSSINIR
jgi:hypothetical protein